MKFFVKIFTSLLLFLLAFSINNIAEANTYVKQWKVWEEKSNVSAEKIWNISFNHQIDVQSVTTDTIYVENSFYQREPVKLKLSNDGKTVSVFPVTGEYEPGSTYTLYITDSITSSARKVLYEPVKMNFTIESNQEVAPFIKRTNSTNEILFVDGIEEITKDISFSVEGMKVTMDKSENVNIQTGDIFYLPPDEELPFGQYKKAISVVENQGEVIIDTSDPILEEIITNIDLSQEIDVKPEHFRVSPDLAAPNNGLMASRSSIAAIPKVQIINRGNDSFEILLTNVEIKNGINLDGSLKISKPKVKIDIEPSILNPSYKLNRLEFEASEDINIKLSNRLLGESETKKLIGTIPVPFAGLPKAGVNLNFYLVMKSEGKVEIIYEFSQSLDLSIGVLQNETNKLEPINEVVFKAGITDMGLEGEALLQNGIETGLYLMIGNFSITSLNVSAKLNSSVRGEPVFLQPDQLKTCYRANQSIAASGQFTIGEKIKNKWFEFDAELIEEIFNFEKEIGSFGNCSFSGIKISPKTQFLSPGELRNITVTGISENLGRTIEEISIPNYYVKFTSDDNEAITINMDGKLIVNENATDGKIVNIGATYEDPISRKTTMDSFPVTIRAKIEDEKLDKEKIKLLINELPGKVEGILLKAKMEKRPFDNIKQQLLSFASEEFIDSRLKGTYEEMCTECDMILFSYFWHRELDVRLNILENTSKSVIIETVELNDYFNSGAFIKYHFINEDGIWKMEDYEYKNVGEDSLDLTSSEALDFVKYHYIDRDLTNVKTSLNSTEYKTVYDWFTQKKHLRKVYIINVETEEQFYKVSFYSHDGLIEEHASH